MAEKKGEKMIGSYDIKVPEDTDVTLGYDMTANKVKNFKFSGIWTWIVSKLKGESISDLNTTNKTDLEKSLISNIVFELLGYMAEKERIKILKRQKEGIQALKDRNNGKGIGRPKTEIPKDFEKEYKLWKEGKQTATETFNKLGIKKTTFYKLVKQYEGKEA